MSPGVETGVTFPRADLVEFVQFYWPRFPEECVPRFGPKSQHTRKASLKFAKTHRAYERRKIRTEESDFSSTASAWPNRHN